MRASAKDRLCIRQLRRRYYDIRSRCYNEDGCVLYERYGGVNIRVCKEWYYDMHAFIKWSLANGFKKGLVIDRIDNDWHYSPDNCRWVTQSVNVFNNINCYRYKVRREMRSISHRINWVSLLSNDVGIMIASILCITMRSARAIYVKPENL